MSLMQLALAAEHLAQERPPVTVDAARCHHTRDKDSPCDLCLTACPTEAISLADGVQMQADRCIRCGLCLHICPTGVFAGQDGVHALLRCVDGLADREIIEVACKPHPDPSRGERDVAAVIQTGGCLSALSASAYISLLALGVEDVRVRLDACADCPLRIVQPAIEATITEADAIIRAGALAGQVRPAAVPGRWSSRRRPVYSVKNPPVSRRGFFRMVTLQAENALKELSDPLLSGAVGATRERQRVILALSRQERLNADALVPGPSYTRLQASAACTACGLCARVCPTDALQLNTSETAFYLDFQAAACTNCGLCLSYCDAGALQRAGQPTFEAIVAGTTETLITGPLHRCQKCGAVFNGQPDAPLCPTCTARHAKPFSPNIPPAVLKRLPADAQRRLRAFMSPPADTPTDA